MITDWLAGTYNQQGQLPPIDVNFLYIDVPNKLNSKITCNYTCNA